VPVVDPALEEEPTIRAEEERVGSDERTVRPGHLLALVVEVRERIHPLARARLHRLEAIGGKRAGIVGVNRDELDPSGGVAAGEIDETVLPSQHVRAVVAPENDDQIGPVGKTSQRVSLPIDARKIELGRPIARMETKTVELGHPESQRPLILSFLREDVSPPSGGFSMGIAAGMEISSADQIEYDAKMLAQALPFTRAVVLDDTSLSLGVQPGPLDTLAAAAERLRVPLRQRGTGGTGVLALPGDIVWTIVLPRSDPRVGRDYLRAYDRFGSCVVELLAAHGLTAAWGAPPGRSKSLCPLGAGGMVLWREGRVVGAAAQHLTGRALLHHGIVFWPPRSGLARALWPDEAPAIDELLGAIGPTEKLSPRAWAKELSERLYRWLEKGNREASAAIDSSRAAPEGSERSA